MATTLRLHGARPRASRGLATTHAIIDTLIRPLRIGFYRRRTMAELSRLDDRMLADIGLRRDQIPEVARRIADERFLGR